VTRRKKNAGLGYGFEFHGAFAKKSDAQKKEKQRKGSFIKSSYGIRGHRYLVLSPRTNPRKRRKNVEVQKGQRRAAVRAVAAFRKMEKLLAEGKLERSNKLREHIARLNARYGWTMADVAAMARGENPTSYAMARHNPVTAYNVVRGGDWQQESYESRSGDARKRAQQLRKLGFKVSVEGMGSQVTPVGRVTMTLLTIHKTGDREIPPPDRVERSGNPQELLIMGANPAMPLKGHPYHQKSDASLEYIMRDASEAAANMRAMGNREKEAKYLDQVNDAATVLAYRRRGGNPGAADPTGQTFSVPAGSTITIRTEQ
jgi:hypothetical protein